MRPEFAGRRHGRKRVLALNPVPVELLGSRVRCRHLVRWPSFLHAAAESQRERDDERHDGSFRTRDIRLRKRQRDGFKRVPVALTSRQGGRPRHLAQDSRRQIRLTLTAVIPDKA